MKSLFTILIQLIWMGELIAQDELITLNSNGLDRTFILHLPNGNFEENLPVVIALHGDGGSGEGMRQTSGFNAVSDSDNFIVAYPNSTNLMGNGIWNKAVNEEGPDDVLFISDLIDFLCEEYQINNGKVYVTGHSGGAFMTYNLAIMLSEKIAAFAPVAGLLYGDEDYIGAYLQGTDFLKRAIYHIHGDQDGGATPYPDPNHAPDEWGEWPLNGFSYPTCGATTYSQNDVSDIAPTVKRIQFCKNEGNSKEISLIRVMGHGHSWPNVTDFIASERIWDFFKEYEIDTDSQCSLSTQDIKSVEISIYPNPVIDNLQIKSNEQLAKIEILDLNGRVVKISDSVNTDEIKLNLQQLPKGVYILRIITNNRNVETQKFMKK